MGAVKLFLQGGQPVAIGVEVAIKDTRRGLRVVGIGIREILVEVREPVQVVIVLAVRDAIAVGVGNHRIQAVFDLPRIGEAIPVHVVKGVDLFPIVRTEPDEGGSAFKRAGVEPLDEPIGGVGREVLDLPLVPGRDAAGSANSRVVVEPVVQHGFGRAADQHRIQIPFGPAPDQRGDGSETVLGGFPGGIHEGHGFAIQNDLQRAGFRIELAADMRPGVERQRAQVGRSHRHVGRQVGGGEGHERPELVVESQAVVVHACLHFAHDDVGHVIACRDGGRIDPGAEIKPVQTEAHALRRPHEAAGAAVEFQGAGLGRRKRIGRIGTVGRFPRIVKPVVIRVPQAGIRARELFLRVAEAVAVKILGAVGNAIAVGIDVQRTGSAPELVEVVQTVVIFIAIRQGVVEGA